MIQMINRLNLLQAVACFKNLFSSSDRRCCLRPFFCL